VTISFLEYKRPCGKPPRYREEYQIMRFHEFVPRGEFEKSVFEAAKEAERFFAVNNVGVWEILSRY
jgi:hypothetical protein